MKDMKWFLVGYTILLFVMYFIVSDNKILQTLDLILIVFSLVLTISSFKYVEPEPDPTYDEQKEIEELNKV